MSAHYEMVAGLAMPARLSGHPALDFCNTWSGWDGHEPGDYLRSYQHLAVWAGFTGLLPQEQVSALLADPDQERAEAVLARARRFRASLYQVIMAGAAGPAWTGTASEVHAAAQAVRLQPDRDAFRWEIPEDTGLRAPLLAAAWSAAALLTSPERAFIRACPGTGCGWLFLDRRGRRRWCTMAACGNREKARRFSARRRERAPSRPCPAPRRGCGDRPSPGSPPRLGDGPG